jgi:hypothetical protein
MHREDLRRHGMTKMAKTPTMNMEITEKPVCSMDAFYRVPNNTNMQETFS